MKSPAHYRSQTVTAVGSAIGRLMLFTFLCILISTFAIVVKANAEAYILSINKVSDGSEPATNALFEIKVSPDLKDGQSIILEYWTQDNTATFGDYMSILPVSTTLTGMPPDNTEPVTVSIKDDPISEGTESFDLVVKVNFFDKNTFPDTLNVLVGETIQASADIIDNDNPPVAMDDTATVVEDSGANPIDVLGNDSDLDGDTSSLPLPAGSNGGSDDNGGGTLPTRRR